jgi:hypothetical protein
LKDVGFLAIKIRDSGRVSTVPDEVVPTSARPAQECSGSKSIAMNENNSVPNKKVSPARCNRVVLPSAIEKTARVVLIT